MRYRTAQLLRMDTPTESIPGKLFTHGATVPTDATAGYAAGCLFQDTTNGALYLNEGSYTSCDFNIIAGVGDNLVVDSVTVAGGTAVRALRLGTFATGAATTSAIPFSTSLDTYTDGQLDVAEIHGSSASNLGSGYSAKCLRIRHVINASAATVEHETYGLVGQLVVRSATLGHLHAGIMGTLEGHTSGAVCSTNYTFGHAAVMARVGGASAITATDPVCGFIAFWNNSAALVSGHSVAYAADCSGTTYKWDYGVDLPGDSVVTGIRVGTFASGGATTGGVPFATAQDIYSDGQLSAIDLHGASASDLGSGYCAKVIRARHVIQSAACAQETYGVMGQVVAKSSTLSHLHAGVIGTFEGHTSGVTLNSAYTVGHAGVMSRIGGQAAITATTPIAGFLAFWNAAAALASGSSIAYAVDCYGTTYKWSYGLDFPGDAVVTGIRVGAFASSGATTSGVPFAAAQDIYSDGQLSSVDLHGASASDLGSSYCAKVVRARHIVNSTDCAHETYGAMGQVVVKSTTMTHLHAGLIGTFEGHTSGVVLNSSYAIGHAAVMARVGGHAAITATTPICGFLAFNNAGAELASGLQFAFGATSYSDTYTWDSLLCADNCDVVLYAPTATNYECGVKTATVTPTGNTTHAVKIRIGASTYAYIPCYSSDAFGN